MSDIDDFKNVIDEEEADDIRVTLNLDDGDVECRILTIYECGIQEYIVLVPLDANGEDNEAGDVYIYKYFEDENGEPSIENITDDKEYEIAEDRFEEIMDEMYFDSLGGDED